MEQYTLKNIAGYTKEKKELIKIINILNDSSNLNSRGGYIPKGMIFYGEPGNGKTLFSKVLSSETNFDFFEVNITDGKFYSNLKKVYKKALKKEKAIIFVDEINRVIAKNVYDETDETRKNMTTLLSLIDGYKTKEKNTIFFVATANDYEDLPNALIRPGRIDKKINIANPSKESRKEILDYYINKTDCNFLIDSNRMIELTKNLSSAGLKTLVNECVISSENDNKVSEKTFIKKINEIINETIIDESLKKDDYMFAYQELGRFIIANHYFVGDYILNINNSGSSSGELFDSLKGTINMADDENDDDDDDDKDDDENLKDENTYQYSSDKIRSSDSNYLSKNELLANIQVLMGGIIANIKFNKGPYSIDRYSFGDIRSIIDYGFLCGFFGNLYTYSIDEYSNKLSNEKLLKREQLLDDIILEQYSIAETIIEVNKDIIKKLVSKLAKEKVLDKNQVDKILLK